MFMVINSLFICIECEYIAGSASILRVRRLQLVRTGLSQPRTNWLQPLHSQGSSTCNVLEVEANKKY